MIKIKIEKNKKNEPIFKLSIKDNDIEKHRFLKRALLESKKIKGRYNYIVPIRYFEPIYNNINKCDVEIHKNSILSYLEFSDDYDEKYYYKVEANSDFMKKWRIEGCPNIYKISIDINDKNMEKSIVFKKKSINL